MSHRNTPTQRIASGSFSQVEKSTSLVAPTSNMSNSPTFPGILDISQPINCITNLKNPSSSCQTSYCPTSNFRSKGNSLSTNSSDSSLLDLTAQITQNLSASYPVRHDSDRATTPCFQTSFRRSALTSVSDSPKRFQYKDAWDSLTAEIKLKVVPREHRLGIFKHHIHKNCFHGTEIIDAIVFAMNTQSYWIMKVEDKTTAAIKNIAIKLGQKFLELNVIYPVEPETHHNHNPLTSISFTPTSINNSSFQHKFPRFEGSALYRYVSSEKWKSDEKITSTPLKHKSSLPGKLSSNHSLHPLKHYGEKREKSTSNCEKSSLENKYSLPSKITSRQKSPSQPSSILHNYVHRFTTSIHDHKILSKPSFDQNNNNTPPVISRTDQNNNTPERKYCTLPNNNNDKITTRPSNSIDNKNNSAFKNSAVQNSGYRNPAPDFKNNSEFISPSEQYNNNNYKNDSNIENDNNTPEFLNDSRNSSPNQYFKVQDFRAKVQEIPGNNAEASLLTKKPSMRRSNSLHSQLQYVSRRKIRTSEKKKFDDSSAIAPPSKKFNKPYIPVHNACVNSGYCTRDRSQSNTETNKNHKLQERIKQDNNACKHDFCNHGNYVKPKSRVINSNSNNNKDEPLKSDSRRNSRKKNSIASTFRRLSMKIKSVGSLDNRLINRRASALPASLREHATSEPLMIDMKTHVNNNSRDDQNNISSRINCSTRSLSVPEQEIHSEEPISLRNSQISSPTFNNYYQQSVNKSRRTLHGTPRGSLPCDIAEEKEPQFMERTKRRSISDVTQQGTKLY